MKHPSLAMPWQNSETIYKYALEESFSFVNETFRSGEANNSIPYDFKPGT
jgi:hypothetical protein